jgi:hypothetical protein
MAQFTRLPPYWQSPAPPPPCQINDISDDAYQFSLMSNNPFAKVGCVKIVESTAVPQPLAVSNEPQDTKYPDKLVNPPEIWLQKSPKSPQPMHLISPIPLSLKSSLWLDQQVQRQLGTVSSEYKTPHVPVKPKPVKALDLYSVRKPASNPRHKATATNKQVLHTYQQIAVPQKPQTMPSQSTSITNPNLPTPNHQELYGFLPSITGSLNAAGYQGSYFNNAYHISRALPTKDTHPTFNFNDIPSLNMAIHNQFPIPSTPAMTTESAQAAFRTTSDLQPYSPNTHKTPSPYQAGT